jgi:hypothetical protein
MYEILIHNNKSTANCPIGNCPGGATTRHNMRRHFAEFQPNVKFKNKKRRTTPQMPRTQPVNEQFYKIMQNTTGKQTKEEAVTQNNLDNQVDIKIGGETNEKVESFLYLG